MTDNPLLPLLIPSEEILTSSLTDLSGNVIVSSWILHGIIFVDYLTVCERSKEFFDALVKPV